MPREWKEYMKDEERRAHGQWMAEAMQAILDSVGAPTLAQLQRFEYKHTDAGISVSFELDDGSHVWWFQPTSGWPPKPTT